MGRRFFALPISKSSNEQNIFAKLISKPYNRQKIFRMPISKPSNGQNIFTKPISKPYIEQNIFSEALSAVEKFTFGYLIVEFNITDALKGASLEVVDMLNRKLESIAITTAKGQTMIKTVAYAKGNYLAGIFNADKLIKSCKFVLK